MKKNNANKKIEYYKMKNDYYANRISNVDKKINETKSFLLLIKVTNGKSYNKKRKCLKTLSNLLVLKNKLQGQKTKFNYSYEWSKSLVEHKVNKPNDLVYHDFIEYIESNEAHSEVPYNPYRIFHLNRWTKKLNKLLLKISYIEFILENKKLNKAKKLYLSKRLDFLKDGAQSFESYINDTKLNFFSKFHSKQVSRLEKLPKSHGAKKIKSKYVIDLKNAVKYYNNGILATKVLKGVNLQIPYGEFVVILGPSGSGKTTLLNVVSGMDTATYGTTVVCNNNLINYSSSELTDFRRKNIGYVFQQYGLLPNLSIKENVEVGSNLQTNKAKRINIDELLKSVGIYEHRNKFPHELSGGQQQRVSIARSVAKNPDIIFGDEPTGAIDEEMSKQIMQLFLDVNKKYKTTIIIVTHNPIFADLATMVIKVKDGNIAQIIKNKKPKKVEQLNWTK